MEQPRHWKGYESDELNRFIRMRLPSRRSAQIEHSERDEVQAQQPRNGNQRLDGLYNFGGSV